MFKQRQYELRVEGRGACEFRASRPYIVGDSLELPLPYEGNGDGASGHHFVWAVVAVQAAERAHFDAVLLLAPAVERLAAA
jgi:hypothetical protein